MASDESQSEAGEEIVTNEASNGVSQTLASIPDTQLSEPAHAGQQPQRGWRWSREQTLYFLELLLVARREGRLNIQRSGPITLVLRTFLPSFQARWPEVNWSTRVLANKLWLLKKYWRVFREAYDRSGTDYDDNTGRLHMSDENEEVFGLRFGGEGRKVLREGLPHSDVINFETWGEIFSDDLPAGRHIHAPDDTAYWQRRRGRQEDAMADEDDDEPASQRPRGRQPSVFPGEEGDESVLRTQASQPGVSGLVPGVSRTSFSQPGGSPQRRRHSSSSMPPPNAPTAASRKRKRSGFSWDQMRELLQERDVRRQHSVVTRPKGSEDIEKAIASCEEIMSDKELPVLMKAINWLYEDSVNAVVWNALGSVAAKEALLEGKIGPLE